MPWCWPWPTRPRWSLPPTCSDNSFCHHSAAEAMNLITQFNLVVGCPPQCTAWSVALNVDHKPGTHRVLHSEWDRARLLGRPRFRHTLCPWFTHNLSLQHCRSDITFVCAAAVTQQAHADPSPWLHAGFWSGEVGCVIKKRNNNIDNNDMICSGFWFLFS